MTQVLAEASRPEVVLLDVGGVFLLPDPAHLAGVYRRAGFEVTVAVLLEAHYVAAIAYPGDYDGELPHREYWATYCGEHASACGIPEDRRRDVVEHLMNELTTSRIWTHAIEGAASGLRALEATGVELGIVSNADGTIAEELAARGICQVGPGAGVDVHCIVDSGAVGVEKPDPRIFKIALDALDAAPERAWYVGDTPVVDVVGARRAGIHPVLVDPHGLGGHLGVDRVLSLHDLAARVRAARD